MAEIRNPNLQGSNQGGGGGGDMRTMFAMFTLVFAVVIGYQYLFKPKSDAPKQAPQAQQSQQQTVQQISSATTAGSTPQAGGSAAGTQAATTTPQIVAEKEAEITVENELYRITFTNRGARVKHWILKRYSDSAGKPLDLVQPQAAEKFGYPLELFAVTYPYDQNQSQQLTQTINQGLYQVSGAQPNASVTLAPAALSFHYSANGVDVLKTIRFDATYVLGIETQVRKNGQLVRALVEWPSGFGDQEELIPPSVRAMRKGQTFTASSFAWSMDGKQDFKAAGKVSGNETLEGDYEYAAANDLYFAAAFMPETPSRATILTLHHAIDLPSNLEEPTSSKRPDDVLGVAAGDTSGTTKVRLYAGPKQMEVLASIHATAVDGSANGPDLKTLVQFGWLKPISYPLYLALRYLYEHGIGNWGWAIVIITAIFNLLMLPTRLMMMKSSLKMARIQPKINAIKARYAHMKMTDPRRADMNTETMALYKEEGINMYGGCLPMLIQMPLFFALYRLLANVIELRQAHWFYIGDLSLKDPYLVLPAVIILCMFITQLITPAPGMDQSQRRMMAFMMPIVMGFTLSNFAAGLSVYWATSNLMNLLIQLGINASPIGRELHALAAKRQAKKVAGNKVIQGKR